MNRTKPISISSAFLFSMILVAALAILVIACLWISSVYRGFHHESAELRARYLESQKNMVRDQVRNAADHIEFKKSLTEMRLKKNIRSRTYEAYEIALNICRQNEGLRDQKELQKMVKDALRPIRFNGGRGYYFATNLAGVEQLFADRPDLEGLDLIDMRDTQGKTVIRDMIEIAKTRGEGFYEYTWTKPSEERRDFPKIAFIKHFEPFEWFIGTGEYLDDVERDVQRDVLERLGKIRFGKDGYIFVGRFDGFSLLGPEKGGNVYAVTDIHGVKIIQELIRVAKRGGGFVSYVVPPVKGAIAGPKTSYVEGIKDWGWFVGAGVYVDEIDKVIAEKKRALEGEVKGEIAKIIATLFGLLAFIILLAKVISGRAKRSFEAFTTFFERAATESASIDQGQVYFSEFNQLALSANRMLKDRQKAEGGMRESESKYRMLVENMTGLIVKLDAQLRLLFVSPTYCEAFGQKEEELLGQAFLPLVHEDDRQRVSESLQRVMHDPYTTYHEERAYTKEGLRWFAWSLKGVTGNSGEVESIIAIGRDITEEREAEERLRESEKRFRDLFDSISDLVYTQDLEGRLLSFNPALSKLFGYSEEELLGRRIADFMKPELRPLFESEYLGQIIEGGSYRGVSSYYAKDGRKIYIEYHSTLVTPERASPYISGTGRDVTDRVLAERRIKILQEEMLHAKKMEAIGTLAGGIAHDFNNLLMGIQGNASLLLLDMDSRHPHYERMKSIEQYVKSGADLTRQLLGFARGGRYEVRPTDMNEVVERSVQMFGRTRKEIHIQSKLQEGIWSTEVDRGQIEQVLLNLYVNAWQAMPGGGNLYLETENVVLEEDFVKGFEIPLGRYVKVSVTDTGVGMDGPTRQRIFEPFFTTKEMGRGTGLGLAVVYGIVRSHGGFIDVYSEKGHGTTFRLYLPASMKEASAEVVPGEEISRGSETVLLVDDEDMIIEVCRDLLEELGYHVIEARSGEEALRIYKERGTEIDLVILDLIMPDMGGGEAFDRLKRLNPGIKVLLSSGYSLEGQAAEILERGCSGFIQKPFAAKSLSLKIREVL
ncbi:MAG: cache domain-containing protein, partial [Deltaproteobacteria bacterium]|nr:cache domain-containing protein [Deltaproteobacteria bacterium]